MHSASGVATKTGNVESWKRKGVEPRSIDPPVHALPLSLRSPYDNVCAPLSTSPHSHTPPSLCLNCEQASVWHVVCFWNCGTCWYKASRRCATNTLPFAWWSYVCVSPCFDKYFLSLTLCHPNYMRGFFKFWWWPSFLFYDDVCLSRMACLTVPNDWVPTSHCHSFYTVSNEMTSLTRPPFSQIVVKVYPFFVRYIFHGSNRMSYCIVVIPIINNQWIFGLCVLRIPVFKVSSTLVSDYVLT